MCGIVGLYLKDKKLESQLGHLFTPMLIEMTNRGPDSAGVAVYRDPVPKNELKITLAHTNPAYDWQAIAGALTELHGKTTARKLGNHCVLVTKASEDEVRTYLAEEASDVRIVGVGHVIEIFKEVGLPKDVAEMYDLENVKGSHIIGHTRMATESAVTTAGSHPFATGQDLCLVHNGSLSNHNRLREWLTTHAGMSFQTENDTEVAAAYLTWRLREGASLKEALEFSLEDLDGFYTFVAGTADGFAVLRDPIACKPAVMAETDEWVAFGSEFRALRSLPGVDKARVWEPEPAIVYSWGKA
ncbi:MAG: glutamine amidotransferase family protein [Hyphomicrobiaceae bacterium]